MRFLLLYTLLCVMPVFLSCSDNSVQEPTKITVSERSIAADAENFVTTLKVDSNQDWQTKPAANWYTIAPSSGKTGSTDVTISVNPNFTGETRKSKITFSANGATSEVTIQQSEQMTINPLDKSTNVDRKGGTYAIASDKEYQASVPDGIDWISFAKEKGVLKMIVKGNTLDKQRICVVTFTDKTSKQTTEQLIVQHNLEGTIQLLWLDSFKVDNIPSIIDIKTKEIYFPVDMDVSPVLTHKIEFSGLGVDYLMIDNKKIKSGDNFTFSTFEAQTKAEIKICNDLVDYKKTTLNITGLPLISINAPSGIVDDPKRPCDMIFIDPKCRTNYGDQKNLKYFEVYAGIEWRGSGALRYDKKAYGFKLRERGTEESIDAELLGLRDDNNWILDAMWLDKAKMRNRVCFDIWNEFNELYYKISGEEKKANSGTHGHLVEVFLDGAYHGMYTLSDKLDRKQLKLKKEGGYLYKLGDWTDECMLRGYTSNYDNSKLAWNGVEMDYPDEIGLVEFKYYKELIDFVSKTSKEEFSANFEDRIDAANMIDCFLYTNLLLAFDNIGRNTYWGIYDIKKSNKMVPLVWDLDGTLGRSWDQQKEDPNIGWLVNSRHNGISYLIYERIVKENPAGIHAKIKARWNDIKNKALSKENMSAKLDYYAQQQIKSGANVREMNRWNSGYSNVSDEITYIKEWYAKRWAKIDELVNSL